MAGTSPVAGLPWKALTDPPNANALNEDLTTALDHVVIPKYSTTTARDLANPTPVGGDLCRVDPFYYWYDAVTTHWIAMYAAGKKIFYQGADQSVNTSTMTSATGLAFAVISGQSYSIDGWIQYAADFDTTAGPTLANMKVGWSTPGSNTVKWCWGGAGSQQAGAVNSTDTAWRSSSTPRVGGQTAQANNFSRVTGTYTCDTTGTVHFQFAQQLTVSGSTHSAIIRGAALDTSFLIVEKII